MNIIIEIVHDKKYLESGAFRLSKYQSALKKYCVLVVSEVKGGIPGISAVAGCTFVCTLGWQKC